MSESSEDEQSPRQNLPRGEPMPVDDVDVTSMDDDDLHSNDAEGSPEEMDLSDEASAEIDALDDADAEYDASHASSSPSNDD